MTPTEFLQKRKIISLDNTDLIIGFDNGTNESLIELLESYHETKVKNLGLFSVSQQRELLLAFMRNHYKKHHYSYPISEIDIEDFLKANNCG